MVTKSHKLARFELPARIRNKKSLSDDLKLRMALIDRIADFPGIETVECRNDTVPCQVDVYLKRDTAERVRRTQSPPLLYSLSCNGVMVSGLDRSAQHKVVSRGWGKLFFAQVLVFLPRDNKELDVVWKILQRAYDNLFDSSANESGTHIVSTWDWPKCLRTTLH